MTTPSGSVTPDSVAMTSDASAAAAPLTVHHFRSRWKPIKLCLMEKDRSHPTHIRFHRACSWLQRTETAHPTEDLDMILCFQWIAFNALYGQWAQESNEPASDRFSWQIFLGRLTKLDKSKHLQSVLIEHKTLVLAILDDAHLGNYFWQDPTPKRARQTTHNRRNASGYYADKNWGELLRCVFDHIYFFRCQIVHGASTHGSRENRTTARRCAICWPRCCSSGSTTEATKTGGKCATRRWGCD